MKPFINKLADSSAQYLLKPFWLLRNKGRHITLLVIAAIVLSGCFQHYFKTNSRQSIDAATVQRLMSANKYVIIHFKDRIVALNGIALNGDNLIAEPIELTPEHKKQLNPVNEKIANSWLNSKVSHRVKKVDKEAVLMEVHLYTEEILAQKNTVNLPLSSFYRTDVYEFDKDVTTSNHIFSIIGVTLGSLAVIGGIAFLITCNCPQVYVNNQGQYEFKSGVYSGAVYSSLERTDYLPLEGIKPVNDKYQVQIHNAKDEKQFINQVQLLKVFHNKDQKVLLDRHGKAITYQSPLAPKSAIY
ncbi:MAG: hypothetical protein KDF60_18780, partial [Calditrichaeota bacterium]|nr:hypothetical protein [Calditrichota bacterium]